MGTVTTVVETPVPSVHPTPSSVSPQFPPLSSERGVRVIRLLTSGEPKPRKILPYSLVHSLKSLFLVELVNGTRPEVRIVKCRSFSVSTPRLTKLSEVSGDGMFDMAGWD